jgi:hypothetical protein
MRTFGPKGNKVMGGWRSPYNDLHDLYTSPSTVRIKKSRGIRGAGNVDRMDVNKNLYRIFMRKAGSKETTRKTWT